MSRYSRQERFTPIGVEGQRRIRSSHVLIMGAGALGASSSEALVRAGVGKVTLVDRDVVEMSNLQRQQLYTERDAIERIPKAVAAKKRLEAINSDVEIVSRVMDVGPEEIDELTEDDVDLILDAGDNFDIRLMINDIAQKKEISWIYGACVGSYGLTYTVLPGVTPCLHCLMRTVPMGGATCDTAGIISPAVNMVVVHQVAEALKILSGNADKLHRRLISFDLWENTSTAIKADAAKRKDCPSCGDKREYPYLSVSNLSRSAVLCGRDTVQIRPPRPIKRDLPKTAQDLQALHEGKVEQNPYLVSFRKDDITLAIFADGRVLVHGTKDTTEARSMVTRYLG